MCFSTAIVTFVCIYASASAQSQNGGSLHCPVEWVQGDKVSLVFLINETLFQNTCTHNTESKPEFRRKTSASGTSESNCTVSNDITADCSFTSGSLGCGCVARNGSYVVEYNFIAHPEYDGSWSAFLQCIDSTANQRFTFTARNCDDRKVKASACQSNSCSGIGACKINDENKGSCICPHDHHEEDCSPCGSFDFEDGCDLTFEGVILTVIVITVLSGAGSSVYLFYYEKTWVLPVPYNCEKQQDLDTFLSNLRSACQDIMNELGGKPYICVEVLGTSLHETIYVVITCRRVHILVLVKNKVAEKTKEFTTDPQPDYPGSNASGR